MGPMGVVTARLLFLGFLALTAIITYNALYLQEHEPHGMADARPAVAAGNGKTQVVSVKPSSPPSGSTGVAITEYAKAPSASGKVSAVVTDLPPLASTSGESQLVVRAVQRELAMRGYDVGPVDGQLSNKTRAAISAFQTREGLVVTGLPSDDLLRQILLGDTIAVSDATGAVVATDSIAANAGEDGTVIRVQQVLAELGYAPGPIDGAWGENTARAVSAFQRDRSMMQTGTITPQLLAEFQRVTGRDFAKTASRP